MTVDCRLSTFPTLSTCLQIWLVALSFMLGLAGCGEDELTGPRCGEGTVASGSQCVPRVVCGAGTEPVGDVCVNPESSTCGENTVEVDGECRAVEDMICAEGTVLVDLSCVGDPGPTCGSGTRLEGTECVVSDEVSCGSGTERVGNECLPSIVCGEGTTLVGADCVSDRALGASLATVCDALAADFCEGLQSCCGAQPTELNLTYRDVLGYGPACDVYMTATCFQNVVDEQAAAVALGQAELSVDPVATLSPYYGIESCELTVRRYDAVLNDVPEVTLVSPLQGGGEPCVGNSACALGLTCVEDVQDAAACRTRGSAGIACDPGDNDDCQQGFYCRLSAGEHICVSYGTLHPLNDDCSDRLCDPDLAWCSAGTCTAYVAEGEGCSLDAACGAGAYCREGTCSAYRQVTESCDDVLDRCGDDLVCTEESCSDTVDSCIFFDEEGA